jgi:sugar-specific transcriptional regulator TrmB
LYEPLKSCSTPVIYIEMTLERLEESLKEFGFNEEQARIYIFLSRIGPSPAGVVSLRFKINRMRAYRVLKSLEEKG